MINFQQSIVTLTRFFRYHFGKYESFVTRDISAQGHTKTVIRHLLTTHSLETLNFLYVLTLKQWLLRAIFRFTAVFDVPVAISS